LPCSDRNTRPPGPTPNRATWSRSIITSGFFP
jgi:hypothetical protein